MPLSKTAAQSEISNYRKRWFAKRKPMMSVIMEAVTKSASELMNEEALAKANDAESALGELGDDLVTYGYFTATITVFGKTFDEANARIAECEKAVNNQAMVAHTEDFNAVEAWLSSIPGHCYANVRKPLLHTLNLAHLIPISGIWAGDERNNHLKGPALMHVVTGGNTPFRYSHHVGDVGHKLIIGPTGNGKSVFMCLCEAQFLRYPNAQLFIFDIFGSARIPVYALGGEFYDIDAVGPQFQPFRRIDEPAERVWATEWVISILEHERITPSINAKSDVETAMRNLASVPVSQRTITGLSSLVQSTEIRQCLAMHAIGGAYGGIMDSNAENLSLSRLVCFELGQLIDSSILPIVSSYLFHRVTQRLTGAPTAIYVDEAWKQLENPYMKKQLKDWLITTRKANGSIIFASAGLSEIIDNPITPTLLESCMTKVFLPNSQAQKPEMEKIYKRFGLNERQIEILAQAIPKKDYYVSSAKGNRLFELALGPLQLEFLARSGKEDQKIARAIYEAHGKEAFPAKWLEAKGKADLIPLLAGDFDREEQRILAEIQGLKEKLATVRELKIKAA